VQVLFAEHAPNRNERVKVACVNILFTVRAAKSNSISDLVILSAIGGRLPMKWLREHMREHITSEAPIEPAENILDFPPRPSLVPVHEAPAALDLVSEAAEVIRGIQDRAVETETRTKRPDPKGSLPCRETTDMRAANLNPKLPQIT
jgi:hypothetical protein